MELPGILLPANFPCQPVLAVRHHFGVLHGTENNTKRSLHVQRFAKGRCMHHLATKDKTMRPLPHKSFIVNIDS